MDLKKNIEMCDLLDIYGRLLSQNQYDVMSDYYYGGITLTEIAINHNITRQAVLDIIKRCEEKLMSYDAVLLLTSKKSALKSLLISYKNDIINQDEFFEKIQILIEEI